MGPVHKIVPGTKANVDAVKKEIAGEERKRKAKTSEGKMQALMMYRHIDTAIFTGETEDVFGYETPEFEAAKTVLDDKILAEVLKEDNCKINYIFTKEIPSLFRVNNAYS